MLRNLTISRKLAASFTLLLALLAGLSVSAIVVISQLAASLDRAVNSTARELVAVGDIGNGFEQMNARMRVTHLNYVIRELEKGKDTSCGACHDSGMLSRSRDGFEGAGNDLARKIVSFRQMAESEVERRIGEKLGVAAQSWAAYFRQYLERADAGKFSEAHDVLTENVMPLLADVEKNVRDLNRQQQEALAAAGLDSVARISGGRRILLGLMALGLIVCAAAFWVLRGMRRELAGITAELRAASGQVAAGSAEISAASQSVAQGASEQSASLKETANLGEEIEAMARSNAENTRETADLTGRIGEDVARVTQALDGMITAINEIQSSSQEVAKIIKVIDGIAFQTNILALNAAVEAARAGDSGLGFAVVADEVRNLAQRCATAARETSEWIARSMESNAGGRAEVAHVAEAVREVSAHTSRAGELIGQVAQGNQSQAEQTQQIAAAISQMDRVTQQSVAAAEQTAASGEHLLSQAERMKQTVERVAAITG